jgi:hypothetical protein
MVPDPGPKALSSALIFQLNYDAKWIYGGYSPMAEAITINIVGRKVGVQYHPESVEATFRDQIVAREMSLQLLDVQAIEHRA